MIEHLFAGNSTTAEYQCWVLLDDHYVRANGPLTATSDDMSRANIQNLRDHGTEWYAANGPGIRQLMNG